MSERRPTADPFETPSEEDAEKREQERVAFEEAKAELQQRCAAADIEMYEEEDPFGDYGDDTVVAVEFPHGREKHSHRMGTSERIRELLDFDFENYRFVGPYAAICSYAADTIEAPLQVIGPPTSTRHPTVRRILTDLRDSAPRFTLADSDAPEGTWVALGRPSTELRCLQRFAVRTSAGLSLTISGAGLNTHDKALSRLEAVSDSLFFQMDLLLALPLGLVRQRRFRGYPGRPSRDVDASALKPPSRQFDKEAMSPYWYARSATGMPLLQYLAYYQCVEYYFATHSQAEVRRAVANFLKDPSFRADTPSDIGRLLSAIPPKGRDGFGSEKSQLLATLRESVTPEELQEFVSGDELRSEALRSAAPGLTSCKLPGRDSSTGILEPAADRIYDIRCRIVHTKDSTPQSQVDLLLPTSPATEEMHWDIELIEFVAQKVLIAGSTKLEL